jgi:hypothetical protein
MEINDICLEKLFENDWFIDFISFELIMNKKNKNIMNYVRNEVEIFFAIIDIIKKKLKKICKIN